MIANFPATAIAAGIVLAIGAIAMFEAMLRPIPRARLFGFAAVIALAMTIDASRHALFYAALSAQAAAMEAMGG